MRIEVRFVLDWMSLGMGLLGMRWELNRRGKKARVLRGRLGA